MINSVSDRIAARLPFFYGYVMIPVAMFVQIATSPGQTYAISAFTPSLRESLGMNDSLLSLAYMLIAAIGWRETYRGIAVVLLIAMLPTIVLFFRDRPEDVGQRVDGLPEPTTNQESGGIEQHKSHARSLALISCGQTEAVLHGFAGLFRGGQGLLLAVGAVVWVRYYGRTHLGSIRGSTWCLTVAGSGCGP